MKLQELNRDFLYTSDKLEDWSIPTLVDGKYRDDCDGYMLAVYYSVDEFKGKEKTIWFCNVNGNGHVVTEIDGMYIDNSYKKFVGRRFLVDNGYTNFRKVSTVELKARMWLSKIGLFRLIYKIRKAIWHQV